MDEIITETRSLLNVKDCMACGSVVHNLSRFYGYVRWAEFFFGHPAQVVSGPMERKHRAASTPPGRDAPPRMDVQT